MEINYIKNNWIPFESEYEDIKDKKKRNTLFLKYHDTILKIAKYLGYQKNYSYEELMQDSYIYFNEICEKYDPFYVPNDFMPFEVYLKYIMNKKFWGFIQHYYFRANRETVTDFLKQDRNSNKNVEYQNDELLADSYNLEDEILYDESLQTFLKILNKDERFIFTETLNGTKQKEIGEKLCMKQSRVSVILGNIRIKYLSYFNINKNEFKSKAIRNLDIEKYVRQKKQRERNRRRMW